ncbi:hypothetical protein [Sphingomonas sp. 3-13AW]|uniref:hypothetical protein n=1 Tax=Sphingomonas sp. 3-13AW TaxID=3050450 RepID=UPI003BB6ACE3
MTQFAAIIVLGKLTATANGFVSPGCEMTVATSSGEATLETIFVPTAVRGALGNRFRKGGEVVLMLTRDETGITALSEATSEQAEGLPPRGVATYPPAFVPVEGQEVTGMLDPWAGDISFTAAHQTQLADISTNRGDYVVSGVGFDVPGHATSFIDLLVPERFSEEAITDMVLGQDFIAGLTMQNGRLVMTSVPLPG